MRILIVRLRQIGDVVFTTPAIRGLREHFKDSHITYIVEPAAAPVVAANPNIDDVIVTSGRRGLGGFRDDLALVGRLRAGRYDTAIDFHGGPRSSLITWLSGAPVRVGYDVPLRGWMYTIRVPRPRYFRARHAVENQWDLLNALGIPTPDAGHAPVEMRANPRAGDAVAARLLGAGVRPGDPVIVVHVSAGNPFRRWPLDAFTKLVAALVQGGPSRRVVVTSGPSEREAAADVITQARVLLKPTEASRVLNCGEFSLDELRALMDQAALFIGGDSGPLHIAATSTIPIVGVYGPTLPVRSAPWRAPQWITESVGVEGLPCRPCDQRTCTPGDFRCLTWLRPEQVAGAAERALARASSPQSSSFPRP
jgi:lipopolysaccharide heptosyltransferase II